MLEPIQKFFSRLASLDDKKALKESKVSFSSGGDNRVPVGDTLRECPVVAVTDSALINRDGAFVQMAELLPVDLGVNDVGLPGFMYNYQRALDALPPSFKLQLSVLLQFHNPAPDLAYFLDRSQYFQDRAQDPGTGPFHRTGKLALSKAAKSMARALEFWFQNRYPVYRRLVFSVWHDPLAGLRRGIVLGPDGCPVPSIVDGILAQAPKANDELDKQMGLLLEVFQQNGLPLVQLTPPQMCQRVWSALHPQSSGSVDTDPSRLSQVLEQGGRPFSSMPAEEEFQPGMDFNRLADLLMPDTIQIEENWFRVNDVYCSGYVVYDYKTNSEVRLNELRAMEGGFASTLFMEYSDEAVAIKQLERKETELKSEGLIRDAMGRIGSFRAGSEERAVENSRAILEITGRPPIDIRFYIIRTAPNLDILSKRASALENRLRSWGTKYFLAKFSQRQLYQSLVPMGLLALNQKPRNMNAAALEPFFWPQRTSTREDTGMYFGLDLDSGVPVYYDPFGPVSNRNPSFLLLGSSGAGKSVAIRTQMASALMSGARVFACDPEGEMRDFCDKYGGRYIELGRAGGETINPVDIHPDDDDPIRSCTENAVAFMQTIVQREIPEGLEFDEIAKAYRIALLDRKWLEKGNDDRLYIPKNISYDPLNAPRLSDIRDILTAEDTGNGVGLSLASVLTQYADPNGIYSSYFNAPTSFDVSKESLVVFGLQKLNTDEDRSIRVFIWQAMGLIWNEVLRGHHEDPNRATFVFLDEVWKLIRSPEPGKPSIGAKSINNLSRRIRKRHGALFMATQNVGEFLNDPIGKDIFTNTENIILLSVTSNLVRRLEVELGLQPFESEALMRCRTGEGLFRFRDSRRMVKIFVPDDWGTIQANLYSTAGTQ